MALVDLHLIVSLYALVMSPPMVVSLSDIPNIPVMPERLVREGRSEHGQPMRAVKGFLIIHQASISGVRACVILSSHLLHSVYLPVRMLRVAQ